MRTGTVLGMPRAGKGPPRGALDLPRRAASRNGTRRSASRRSRAGIMEPLI